MNEMKKDFKELIEEGEKPVMVDVGVLYNALDLVRKALFEPEIVELPAAIREWIVKVIAEDDPELARIYDNELKVSAK